MNPERAFNLSTHRIQGLIGLSLLMILGCAQGDTHSSSSALADISSAAGDSGLSQQDSSIPPGDSETDSGGDGGEPEGVFISVTVRENPRSTLSAIVTLELAEPLAAAVAFQSDDVPEQITGFGDAAKTQEIVVVGLRANSTYALTPVVILGDGHEVRDTSKSFTTGSLPEGILEMSVVAHQPAKVQPGITLFGAANPQKDEETTPDYVGVDISGAVVWYYFDDAAALPGGGGGGHLDREARQLADGNLLLSLRNDYRVITPGGETLRTISGNQGVKGCNIGLARIHHDMDLMPNGNALVLSSEICAVDGTPMGDNVMVTADTLFELDPEGEIQWEWHALNALDPTRFPGELSLRPPQGPNAGGYDWSHANSVTYLPGDDSVLVSFRHQNWVVKINRETKRPDWILGDAEGEGIPAAFTLADDGAWFYSQHAPVLDGEGRILVYDNGNERPDEPSSYSRAVIYSLDEENQEASQIWEYRTDTYTGFLGDANWLPNGNVLVAAGGVREGGGQGSGGPQPGMAQIVEVTSDDARGADAKVWELQVEAFVYRANRITSFWPQDADKK